MRTSNGQKGQSSEQPVTGCIIGVTVLNRARKWVMIHGVTPGDLNLLGSKRDNRGLVTRIIHNKIFYGICMLHCCTLWFR